ncbi:hypothetical protein [Chryseobacterium sp. KLBC 52]|uniref:hypothetical protein n=1 Tax=Chryseobacterium sp. KLBC 52 TaxID=1862702 RepID=UPI000E0BB5C5|nr:hypothetical protein [Chryseobacterium sp. KLBC 52]
MKKIFFILVFSITLAQCQEKTNSCPDENKFFIRNNTELKFDKKDFNIYESINKENEERFIVINSNGKCIINTKSLLSTDEVEGYATNFIRKTKNGFYYSFEYGNRYHYEYELYFKYLKGKFYLFKVIQKFSDLANPNSVKAKTINVSNKQFSLFDIHNYLPK